MVASTFARCLVLDIEILTHVLLKACSSSPGLIPTHLRVLACLSGLCPLHVQRYLHFHLLFWFASGLFTYLNNVCVHHHTTLHISSSRSGLQHTSSSASNSKNSFLQSSLKIG